MLEKSQLRLVVESKESRWVKEHAPDLMETLTTVAFLSRIVPHHPECDVG